MSELILQGCWSSLLLLALLYWETFPKYLDNAIRLVKGADWCLSQWSDSAFLCSLRVRKQQRHFRDSKRRGIAALGFYLETETRTLPMRKDIKGRSSLRDSPLSLPHRRHRRKHLQMLAVPCSGIQQVNRLLSRNLLQSRHRTRGSGSLKKVLADVNGCGVPRSFKRRRVPGWIDLVLSGIKIWSYQQEIWSWCESTLEKWEWGGPQVDTSNAMDCVIWTGMKNLEQTPVLEKAWKAKLWSHFLMAMPDERCKKEHKKWQFQPAFDPCTDDACKKSQPLPGHWHIHRPKAKCNDTNHFVGSTNAIRSPIHALQQEVINVKCSQALPSANPTPSPGKLSWSVKRMQI